MSEAFKRDVVGRFVKGKSGNPGGRPKKIKVNQEKLNNIYKQAKGDPILLQKLVLENGHHLKLDLATALRLARDLSPYEKPRLSSIDSKSEGNVTFMITDPTKVATVSELKTIEEEDGYS